MFIRFYRLLTVLALPLLLLYLLWRGLRDRRYWSGLRERFGGAPQTLGPTAPGGIWLHAVSVGEVLSAVELARQLRGSFPSQPLYLSTTTTAGRQIAEERLQALVDAIFYAPLDLAWAVRRVHRRLRPQLLIVLETEIWPNLFRETRRFGCELLIANGRISDKTFPRYRRLRWFFAEVLRWPHAVLAQNEQAAERYRALGAPPERVLEAGNLKYDFRAGEQKIPEMIAGWLARAVEPPRIWIAASTMPPAGEGDCDEDDLVIAAIGELEAAHRDLLTILVPRRPERFARAAERLQAAGRRFVRRSALPHSGPELPCTLLLDSMGELASLFPLAEVVFVGGTLARRGGHNILEPACFGKPVIIGPHMENFPDIADAFRNAEAVVGITDGRNLAPAVDGLLGDPERRRTLGERARKLAQARRGATQRTVEKALQVYRNAVPVDVPPPLERLLLRPLAALWRAGVVLDRAWKRRRPGRLRAPVISIGGLAMGGTGKTPVTAWLASALRDGGLRPAILTRGWRRANADRPVIALPGQPASVADTGDEAQLLLRRGDAIVGIGADRFSIGCRIEQEHRPDVFLLDDGFQHWRLERDADLVLLDGLDPLGGGALFPLGRLREGLPALRRATACLVTRMDKPVPWDGLERMVRQEHPGLPVFYAQVLPVEWVGIRDGASFAPAALPGREACGAFCGIGNPASFRATLAELGIRPKEQWIFADHHSYLPGELLRMADQAAMHGIRTLLTTEKDAMNLPPTAARLLQEFEIFWLRAGISVNGGRRLLRLLLDRTGLAARTPAEDC